VSSPFYQQNTLQNKQAEHKCGCIRLGAYNKQHDSRYTKKKGGEIRNGTAFDGGGVSVRQSGGVFKMNNGTIQGNTANANGGGVYIRDGGTFSMHGGVISKNNAPSTSTGRGYGAGVHLTGSSSKFEMDGGTIYGVNDPPLSNTANQTVGKAFYKSSGGSKLGTTNNTIRSGVIDADPL
jgi:hypothetical protein